MADGLSIAAAGMSLEMQRLAAISHHLANATTPGFRREFVTTRPFGDTLAAYEAGMQRQTDTRTGTLRATANPLDVAIEGTGWFELLTPEGPVYTRRGDFMLDARGVLVSHQGWPVMGDGGEITLGNGSVRIDARGQVFENDRLAGSLRIVEFDSGTPAASIGAGLFRADQAQAQAVHAPSLRQGHLENANVQPAAEMVRLIETMRRFEAGQKLIQSVDEMLGRAIRTLGDNPN